MFQQRPPVWIGVGINAETLNPSPEGTKARTGLRVATVVFDSPAEKAGVLINDLIVGVDGQEFTAEPAVQDKQFRESILRRAPGDPIILTIVRGADVKDLHLSVEQRPSEMPVKEYSSPKVVWPEEEIGSAQIGEFKIGDAYEDLRQRLARLSTTGDRFRLSRVAYTQREPFQLRTVAGGTLDQVAAAMTQKNPQAAFSLAAGSRSQSIATSASAAGCALRWRRT